MLFDDGNLTTAVQCQDDLVQPGDADTTSSATDQKPNKLVLLNDGQTFPMDLTGHSWSDSGLQTGSSSTEPLVVIGQAAAAGGVYRTDGETGLIKSLIDSTLTQSGADFAFHVDSEPRLQGLALASHVCPMCAVARFSTIEELERHVDTHFQDEDAD